MDHWRHEVPADETGEGTLRVLLVGDDEVFLHRLAEMFDTLGHRVRSVFDPRSAIAAVGHGYADVVVCDLGATKLQSIETILALRSLGDDAPPLVAISAMPNVAQHCAALRVEHYLAQPFRFGRLMELCERLVDDRRNVTERSGVFLREQTEGLLDTLSQGDALSFG